MPRARRFYEQVLGGELSPLPAPPGSTEEMLAFPSSQEGTGAAGALVRLEGFKRRGNSLLVYFQCEDCGVTAQMAVQAGGRIEKDKFSIGPYGHIAVVVDPDGNGIGLHSMQ